MKLRLLVPLLFVIFQLNAQKNNKSPYTFGKIDPKEFAIKECSFDTKAEALVLFDIGETYCYFFPNSNSYPITTEFERHVRVKILSDKGLDKADIRLPFYDYKQASSIKNLTANTYNIDAAGNVTTTKLDKKSIYEKKLNKRYSEIVFTFPEVKVGSIIEYKYKVEARNMYALYDWNFQTSIPVAYSQFTLNFPREIEVDCQVFSNLQVKRDFKQKGNQDVQSYSLENVPALRDEPYISCDKDYLQRLEPRLLAFNDGVMRHPLTTTWPKIIKELMEDEDFGVQLKRNIPRTQDLETQLSKVSDHYSKMVTIYEYVRKNMEWDGSTSIWAMDGVRAAWNSKKGTSGEINFILINLLKDAGLKASPVLVSTRENGIAKPASPDISQFDKVMAYVTIGDHFYVLDATDKHTPANLIPHEVMYSEGLVIEKLDTYEWGWKPLWDDKRLSREFVFLHGGMNADGLIHGEATVRSVDYSKVLKLPALMDSKKKFMEQYYPGDASLKIDSLDIENNLPDSLPLVQKLRYTKTATSTGDYFYFSANMFTGLEKNPFVADTRSSDIMFATNQQYMINGSLQIPDNYQFDEMPKNVRMITPDTSLVFSRVVQVEKNQVMFRISIDFKKPFFSADEYPYFKEFYKTLFDLLNEQFVIKKKSTTKP